MTTYLTTILSSLSLTLWVIATPTLLYAQQESPEEGGKKIVETYQSAASRVLKRVDEVGVWGVQEEITDCYDHWKPTGNFWQVHYCLAMDFALGEYDAGMARVNHWPVANFYADNALRHRFDELMGEGPADKLNEDFDFFTQMAKRAVLEELSKQQAQ